MGWSRFLSWQELGGKGFRQPPVNHPHHLVWPVGPRIGNQYSVLMLRPHFSPRCSFKEFGSADPEDESMETQIVDLYSFCQTVGLLHDTAPTPPSKSSGVGSSG